MIRCDVGVILGSGWGSVHLGDVVESQDVEVTVPGHAGRVMVVNDGFRNVLVMSGRRHLYEHGDPVLCGDAVRFAASVGVRSLVITSASGGVTFQSGEVVMVSDHLNLTGVSPLCGPEFVDLTGAYDTGLAAEFGLPCGVYAQFRGPSYETPAEVRMARVLGADVVGMSMALETIVARSLGLRVVGLSFVSNLAAGIADSVSHEDVLLLGAHHAERLGVLLGGVLGRL